MTKSKLSATKENRAMLLKPSDSVREVLKAQIAKGRELTLQPMNTYSDLESNKNKFKSWNEYNIEYLKRAFSTNEYAEEYKPSMSTVFFYGESLLDEINHQLKRINTQNNALESLLTRLELIEECPSVSNALDRKATGTIQHSDTPLPSRRVFLVHGQDNHAKTTVARFLEHCDLEPIILHEQPNNGRTIIEKFEGEADVGFAVVLLTPDDVGGPCNVNGTHSDSLSPRARQNVILELGYFVGRLGREHVAALKKGDIELPSDISGVLWITLDDSDSWKLSLAKELATAGYAVDLNRAFRM